MPLNNTTLQQLEYFEIVPPAFGSQVNPTTWESWDISASVPTTAKFVEVVIFVVDVNDQLAGVRAPGSSLGRTLTIEQGANINMVCACISQAIERYSGVVANVKFTVVGYWK